MLSRSRQRQFVCAPEWLAVASLCLGLACAPATAAPKREARLQGWWENWQDEVAPLLMPEERKALETLGDDIERERFIHGFWQARGEDARQRWRLNRAAARELNSLAPARTRAVMMLGWPSRIQDFEGCDDAVRRIEVWTYDPWSLEHQTGQPHESGTVLVFVLANNLDMRSYQLWSPTEGAAALGYRDNGVEDLTALFEGAVKRGCLSPREKAELLIALNTAPAFEQLRELAAWERPAPDWLEGYRDRPDPLNAEVRLEFVGRYAAQTVVRGRVTVPIEGLERGRSGEVLDRIEIVGDLYRGTRLVDTFSGIHHVAGDPGDRDSLTLEFYRGIRPGSYRLDLRVQDGYELALAREERTLEVPEMEGEAPLPAGTTRTWTQLLRDEVVTLASLPSVELLPLGDRLTGTVEMQAVTRGVEVAAVEFLVDGRSMTRAESLPFSASLDTDAWRSDPANAQRDGPLIEVVALGTAGEELAHDAAELDLAPRAFQARIDRESTDPGEVEVSLVVPRGRRVQIVECYHGSTRVAVPSANEEQRYRCPRPSLGPGGGRMSYLRVIARLDDGSEAEDVLLVSSGRSEEVEVRLADLWVSVLDRRGLPATGLAKEDFRIREGDQLLPVVRFEDPHDLPLNVGVLMDTSSSLGRKVRDAAASAQGFFERILTDQDLASLTAFNHDIRPLAAFTGDTAVLRYSATGLRARGSTRLWDSLVYSLHLFAGLEHRRALVLLSDGADTESDRSFETAMDATLQAGVAVYPIALGRVDEETKSQLKSLALATGGRFFEVSTVGELDEVYRRIEALLRSRYLLVYRPGDAVGTTPQVDLLRDDLVVESVRGVGRSSQ